MAPPPSNPRRFCFNDGRCDRQGRSYVGPVHAPLGPRDDQPNAPKMSPVWRYDDLGAGPRSRERSRRKPAGLRRGRRRREDRRTRRRAWIATASIFVRSSERGGSYGADPDGKLERLIPVLPLYPTTPAFGGDSLSTLYVTSGSFPIPPDERAAHPDAGALFVLEAPAPGVPEALFRFPHKRARNEPNRR